jgi:predicted transcriptional regulator
MAVRDQSRGEALLRVQSRLTDRDMTLLGWLADHGVLTTAQIAHALYPSLDFAQRRLLKLTRADLLDRFRPQRPDGGSHPYHYLLDQLGVDVMAAQRDEDDLPRRDRARKRRWWLTNRANLPHLLAVNQFFTDLAAHSRTHPDTALERWWPSARCQRQGAFRDLDPDDTRLFFATIAADGHGIWTTTRRDSTGGDVTVQVPFFVEVDLSTEDLPRLAGKVVAYEKWSRTTGHVWPLLFWLDSAVRERHLQDRLRARPTIVPVATAVRPQTHVDAGPAGRLWWLHQAQHRLDQAGTALGRLTLVDLGATVTTTRRSLPHLPSLVTAATVPPLSTSPPLPPSPRRTMPPAVRGPRSATRPHRSPHPHPSRHDHSEAAAPEPAAPGTMPMARHLTDPATEDEIQALAAEAGPLTGDQAATLARLLRLGRGHTHRL